MRKVFVCGAAMSGKNILRKMLDGHSGIVCSHVHDRVAFSLLSRPGAAYIKREWSENRKSLDNGTSSLEVLFESGDRGKIDFSDLLYLFFNFSDYKTLYRCAEGGHIYFKAREGSMVSVPFNFSISKFENYLREEFIGDGRVVPVGDLIDAIYSSYERAWNRGGKKSGQRTDFTFIDTLPNGLEPIIETMEALPDAKILVMDRDPAELLYANAIRISQSIRAGKQAGAQFKRILFGQKEYCRRIKLMRSKISELENRTSNVRRVDFSEMILCPDRLMPGVANFLQLPYEEILTVPTIGGRDLTRFGDVPIIGSINDAPEAGLETKDQFLLKMFAEEYGGRVRNFAKFHRRVRIVLWRIWWTMHSPFRFPK
jgi:hypothetical protein